MLDISALERARTKGREAEGMWDLTPVTQGPLGLGPPE